MLLEDWAGLYGMGRSPALTDLLANRKDAIRMAWMKSRSRVPAMLGIGLALILLAGCQSPGSVQWPWLNRQGREASYEAYRPTYTLPGTKPLYLSNYAGDDYGPNRPRRRGNGVVTPNGEEMPPSVTVNHGSWDSE
jgi:hypothetical protein